MPSLNARRFVASLVSLSTSAAFAQTCQPAFTAGFPNAAGLNNEVRSVALFDAGARPQLYAAGPFTKAGATSISGVARWDGNGWVQVGQGIGAGYMGNPQAYVLAPLTLGGQSALYLGGSFTTPGTNIAKWNGASWSSFGQGLNDVVRAITVYDDGAGPRLYAGGHFYMSGTTVETRGIARWSGSAWQPLGTGLTLDGSGWSPNVGHVYSMAVLDLGDGPKLYVGGRFTSAGGVAAHNIARWNGSQWAAVGPPGSGVFGAESQVMKIAVFDHGFGPQLTIGGRFNIVPGGPVRGRVARWTGAQWVQVGSDLSADAAHTVNAFVALPGSTGPALHVGGIFTGASWLNEVNYAARLGGADWIGLDGGMSDYIWSMAPDAGGAAYAGGKFMLAGDAVAKRVARWDGSDWQGLEQHKGLDGPGYAACQFDSGNGTRIYVGGAFVAAGNHVVNGIASWDGSTWNGIGGGVRQTGGAPGTVSALATFNDGSGPALYAGGAFASAGGGPAFNIARWNGQHWSSPGGNGLNDAARALQVHDDGSGPALYVGGAFGTASGVPVGGIARWNGTTWSPVGPASVTTSINALASFDDGLGANLYAGGLFLQIGGVSTPSLARWDGFSWQSVGGITLSATNTFPGLVNTLAVHDDGSGPALFVGGQFAGAGSVPVHGNIARLKAGGWSALGTFQSLAPTGPVLSLASADDGTGPALYVGGSFLSTWNSVTARSLVRWNGQWSAVGLGVALAPNTPGNGEVRAILPASLPSGNSIFITGAFAQAGTSLSDNFGQWLGCPAACYADCTADGSLTVADFACFQTKFASGSPAADCNASGSLTIADFACFQGAFVGGCP